MNNTLHYKEQKHGGWTFIIHVKDNDKVGSCGELEFQPNILGGYTNLSRNDRKTI